MVTRFEWIEGREELFEYDKGEYVYYDDYKELEEQIEGMKCCGNCKHVDVHLCGLNFDPVTPEFCCAKWELLE